VSAAGEPVVRVLHPDDGHAVGAGPGDQDADVREHAVPAVGGGEHSVLGVDDEQRGVRPLVLVAAPTATATRPAAAPTATTLTTTTTAPAVATAGGVPTVVGTHF
jgi:hypothetical protein